jgi:ribosomal protein L11 methyltransferase
MGVAWWRLEMACPPELEESLLWKLRELGVARVAVVHGPGAPERRELHGWLPESDWPEDQRRELARALAPLGEPFGVAVPSPRWRRQEDEDWSSSWKRHWSADPVGRRLLVLPAWLEPPGVHADRLVIRLDPGSAFGTGSHPTTRLCLEAIEALDPTGLHVADLGCGSGILGLAALRLGARSLAAVDTDPLAIRATRANAALNGFRVLEEPLPAAGEGAAPAVHVAPGSVEALEGLLAGRTADLLLCNILAPVIEALCPAFGRLLAPGGIGLLSGLLVEQAAGLERMLAAQGWEAELSARQERWGLITIRRPGPEGPMSHKAR